MVRYLPLLAILALLGSCDFARPRKSFSIAVSTNDYVYNRAANHLKKVLEKDGYRIELTFVNTNLEANRMVAEGKADLTFVMNTSNFIADELGELSGAPRTILPLFERVFLVFTKRERKTGQSFREFFSNGTIGVEVPNGEVAHGIEELISDGRFTNLKVVPLPKPILKIGEVPAEQKPDFVHLWGIYFSERVNSLMADGWHGISFDQEFVDYYALREPALSPFVLPAVPGMEGSQSLKTLKTATLLVGRSDLGDNSIYELSKTIYEHRLELVHEDLTYRSLSESFDSFQLLYPLHPGTYAYLRRDEPTFVERYVDALALVLTLIAMLFGALQTVRNSVMKRKKERLDLYFVEFADIRSLHAVDKEEKLRKLDDLLQRLILQVTNQKLDKGDFHILSRLIQQEQNNLR